ncbi:MAG: PrgI family protein [Patescibacteria group bacterium]|nr:PrgI family protein [Patescibacteria group bacterium]
MATYKVIQDIEAEDKILGPLTLRQFIYALIMCFFLYLCFIVITKHVTFLLIVFLPPVLFTGFFAFPFRMDQPTEVWAVAKIGFLFKPRKRIWDQSGVKELVTVTVPKKIERVYTNGLSQTEVQSRLSALASTIDTRGWAIKNVNVNMFAQPAMVTDDGSDRLVAMSSMPQPVADYDIKASDDILDETSNPIAQQFTQMITASTQAHRQQLIDTMNGATATAPPSQADPAVDMWFTRHSAASAAATTGIPFTPQVVEPSSTAAPVAPAPATPSADELAFLDHLKEENSTEQVYSSHMKTIQPLSAQPPAGPAIAPPVAESIVARPADPVIENLSRSNDLDIATLAREAHKAKPNDDPMQGEVVISLR